MTKTMPQSNRETSKDTSDVIKVTENSTSTLLAVLEEQYPDLLTGPKLSNAADTLLTDKEIFSVVSLIIDTPNEIDNNQEIDEEVNTAKKPILAISSLLEEICSDEQGIWGIIEKNIFGLVIPLADNTKAMEIALKLKQAFDEKTGMTLSVGTASFPEIDFKKDEIIANAVKALIHAEFFGNDSAVSFDSVSMNICGDNLYQQGDIDGAVKEFKRALTLDPENVNIHISLGVCFGDMEKHTEALEEFETAIKQDPHDVMAPYNAGLIFVLKKDFEKSMEYFKAAEKISPETFEVLYHIGRIFNEQKKYTEAKEYLDRSILINPESGTAHRSLGECLEALDEPQMAKKAFQAAVKINPNDAVSLSALGLIFDRIGENQEIAKTFLEQSVSIAPDNGLFRHRLADMLHRHNNIEQALEEYKKAQEAGHDSTAKIEELQKILTQQAS